MISEFTSPTLTLGEELHIEQIGLGTWNLKGSQGQAAIEHALKVGYRHIDSADFYKTHGSIAEAIQTQGLKREEVFITSKLWSHSLGTDEVGPAVKRFLHELQTEFIDLLLIHWPSSSVPLAETLVAMEATRHAGKIKSIGVSNFNVELMREALQSGVPVVNNQIEYNLGHQPQDILDFCRVNDVTVTAYTPLGRGNRTQEALVDELAEKYKATREQVLLNWLVGKGMIVIPRSKNPRHIEANWSALSWRIDQEDVERINAVK